MEKDRKVMVSGIIGGAAIAAIITVAVVLPGLHSGNNTPGNSQFNRADFNSQTVYAQNTSLYASGYGSYAIAGQNKSHVLNEIFEITPPGGGFSGLTNDVATYLNLSGTHIVYENMTFSNFTVTLTSVMTDEHVSQSIILNNTGPSLQKFSLSYYVYTGVIGNITLFSNPNGGPQEQNVTIVPHTYGYSESYSFFYGGLLGVEYPYYSNTTVSWSTLSGLYTGGTLSFAHGETELELNFGQVSLPPGDSIDLGSISIVD